MNNLTITKAKKKNIIEESLYYRRFCQIALNNFEWINLPQGIKPRYIERCLFFTGSAVFTKTEKMGYIVLPANITGDLDLYYEPKSWNVIGNAYVDHFDQENSVLMRNNIWAIPSDYDARWYAEKIAQVETAIRVNVNLHKTPWLFRGNKNQVLTLKNIFKQVDDGEPAVYIDDNINSNMSGILSSNAPYIIDKLYAYKGQLASEFYELYGYPTTQTEKSERLTMTESEVKVEFSDSGYVGTMYEFRKQACEEINKMYGLDIDVKINRYRQKSEEYYELEKMKLQQGGFNTEIKEEKEDEE